MKRKRYTEEKIISMLKQHEGGRTMVELAREHGITENTLYRWKARYGGMEVSEAKRLRELQADKVSQGRRFDCDRASVAPGNDRRKCRGAESRSKVLVQIGALKARLLRLA